MATAAAATTITLPPTGKARVKNVLSGDTLVLLGSANVGPNVAPAEVLFTLDGVLAPRYVGVIDRNASRLLCSAIATMTTKILTIGFCRVFPSQNGQQVGRLGRTRGL
jgi:hypothetical protein